MSDQASTSQDAPVTSAISECICSYLPESETENFSKQFGLAVSVYQGTDVSLVWSNLVLWLLIDSTYGVVRYNLKHTKEIEQVASLFRRFLNYIKLSEAEWESAAAEARLAAVAPVSAKANNASQKFKAAMCACLAAYTMVLSRRKEALRTFGEDGSGHYTTVYAALEAALEAGGQDWANHAASATRDKFFDLIWEAVYGVMD